MPRVMLSPLAVLALLFAVSPAAAETETDRLSRQVAETERAFAATMANRDHAAFVTFLSDEAVFFSGDSSLRGKQQVADTWKAYFTSIWRLEENGEWKIIFDKGNRACEEPGTGS